MKKALFTFAMVLLAVATQAQIKMHSNGRITFQTLSNTTSQGISIGPAPNCITDFNGSVHFNKSGSFLYNAGAYTWMNCAIASNDYSAVWVVSPNWSVVNFVVYGNGNAYATNHYTFSNNDSSAKGAEVIDGEAALSIVSGLKGYYFEPEEQEIPDLENNEHVVPEAIEAMYADFGKRTVGLSGSNLEEVFPEAVRTDPRNRICIDYQSVVTMLVEAVNEQQRTIETLRQVLEENGLMEPEKH